MKNKYTFWLILLAVLSSSFAFSQTNPTNMVGAWQQKDTVGGKVVQFRNSSTSLGVTKVVTPATLSDSLKNYQKSLKYVTPEEFGAIGDGVTDDKVAIQAAVNSGNPVHLQKKRYYISGSIELIEGTVIVGTGTGTLTNIFITANEPAFLIKGDNINIERVSFIGDYSFVSNSYFTTKPNQHAIALIGTPDFVTQYDRILISNCTFYNMSGAGFYSNYNIGDNGLFAGGAQLTNNLAFGCAFGYFNDLRGEYNTFVNNKAYYCAIGYRNSGGNNIFTGGILNSNNTGAYLEGGANNGHGYIDATSLNHNLEYGVWANGVTLGHTISNSPIYSNDIYVQSSVGIKFFNCDISLNNIYIQSSTLTEFKENKFPTTPTLNLSWNGTNNTGTLNNVKFFNNFFWSSTPAGIQNDVLNNNLDLNGDINVYGTQLNFNGGSSEIVNRNAQSIDIYSSGTTLAGKIYANGNFNLGYNTDQSYKLSVNGTGFFNGSVQSTGFGAGIAPSANHYLTTAANTSTIGSWLWTPSSTDYTGTVSGTFYNNANELKFYDGTISGTNRLLKLFGNSSFVGTGQRVVTTNSVGDAAATTPIIEQFNTDSDVITAITGASYTSANSFSASITPASSKVFYKGQFYKSSTFLYIATSDNVSFRIPYENGTTEVTGTSQVLSANGRYVPNNASLVTLTLPTTAAVGDVIFVNGKGAGLWRVAQNASQIIHGSTDTTTGTTGYIQATSRYNCVTLVCIVPNTEWVIQSSQGSLTIN